MNHDRSQVITFTNELGTPFSLYLLLT